MEKLRFDSKWVGVAFGVAILGMIAAGVWLYEEPRRVSVEVMIDSGDTNAIGHPCATNPQRSCLTYSKRAQ